MAEWINCKPGDRIMIAPGQWFATTEGFSHYNDTDQIQIVTIPEPDQTDLGASDDRPLGPDHIVYRQG